MATAPASLRSAISVISSLFSPLVAHAAGRTRIQASSRARLMINSTKPALSMGGLVFAMVTTVVNPPLAAARLPLAMVSLDSKPGSRKWQCISTNPGATTHPAASMVSSPCSPLPISTTRPSFTSRSHIAEVLSTGLIKCPLMIARVMMLTIPGRVRRRCCWRAGA